MSHGEDQVRHARAASLIDEALVPSEAEIFGWIEAVCARGERRPGSPADR